MSLRNRLMVLITVGLVLTMALWGWIQLNELETLLYRQQEKHLAGIAETVSTYYHHFPTGQGLAALDTALSEQLHEDSSLARIDLLFVSNGIIDYISGVGRAPFEWSLNLINLVLQQSKKSSFPLSLDDMPAIGLLHSISSSEHGVDAKGQICVGVIAYTKSSDEILSEAKYLLIYSTGGLLVFILFILAFSYGWMIGHPLKAIIRTIDQFQRGNYLKRISLKRRDELAQLAEHFNTMADEVEKVLASNEELRRRQEERIKDATHRLGQLQRQVSQLQRLSAMGFLAATLAHDLGTPLHSIAGMATLLLERDRMAQDDKRKLELIVRQASRLSNVIQNVRRATRLPDPHPEPITLEDLFDEILPLIEPLMRYSSVTLETDISKGAPFLLVDRYRLQTALLNIIQNAMEAIKGPGKVKLKAYPVKDARSIAITVEDTGTGIPAELMDRVCEPFFSTHGGDSLRGLGLAIVQDVVKVHGGRMEIKSEQGIGTKISLYFPLADVPRESPLESL